MRWLILNVLTKFMEKKTVEKKTITLRRVVVIPGNVPGRRQWWTRTDDHGRGKNRTCCRLWACPCSALSIFEMAKKGGMGLRVSTKNKFSAGTLMPLLTHEANGNKKAKALEINTLEIVCWYCARWIYQSNHKFVKRCAVICSSYSSSFSCVLQPCICSANQGS